jgi:hypothetical protein
MRVFNSIVEPIAEREDVAKLPVRNQIAKLEQQRPQTYAK